MCWTAKILRSTLDACIPTSSKRKRKQSKKKKKKEKEKIAQCPQHGIEKWRLCQIAYEGLGIESRRTLEAMCNGVFMSKDEREHWKFLEEYAEKTMQWENTSDPITTNSS